MRCFNGIIGSLKRIKYNVTTNDLESIMWLLNLVPYRAGFSILNEKVYAPFWILHLSLLFYVYGVGSVVYQIKFAQGASDFVKSYVNISIFILTVNSSYWFLMKRQLLLTVLKQVKRNDTLSRATDFLRTKHENKLSNIKKILFIFYGFNITNAVFIYVPHRVDVTNDYYSMTRCVGLEPLTITPNREICSVILLSAELTIINVVLNYQALLLFIIAHTSSMYEMLSAEMLVLDECGDNSDGHSVVANRLPSLIRRHSLTLKTVMNIRSMYSMPLGVDFVSNAACICLFFYLDLHEWISFSPVLVYCLLVIFLYCYLCQRLINASEMFRNAIYSCGWEKFAMKEKKMIYVMLLQAQKPIIIFAADIIPVNIYTFASTLQAMFKFVTVVKF